jgi:hypothetical protein
MPAGAGQQERMPAGAGQQERMPAGAGCPVFGRHDVKLCRLQGRTGNYPHGSGRECSHHALLF